jgi:putative nucleotidyltransferase with HDIG domain
MEQVKNILLVDDELSILNTIERLLFPEDCNVYKAQSGEQALEELQKREFALMICDQKMPGMNGAEVLSRARDIAPDTIRVILTGYAEIEILMQSINEGYISQILLKPWDNEYLLELVRDSIMLYNMSVENKELQEQLKHQNEELKELNNSLEQKVAERTRSLEEAKDNLKLGFRDAIEALSGIMEIYSEGLRGHGYRVGHLSRSLAEAVGLDELEVEEIESAAFLHDIGKISMPHELIGKSLRFMDSQDARMYKRHSVIGSEILRGISSFKKLAPLVRHHHESWRGKGYPDLLAGKKIPVGSRIICIADKFDRCLHPIGIAAVRSKDSAKEFLLSLAGDLLDPELTELFVHDVVDLAGNLNEDEVELPLRLMQPGMILTRRVVNVNNIILIKEGTTLDEHLIEHLKENEGFDPLVSRLYIDRRSIRMIDDYHEASQQVEMESEEVDRVSEESDIVVIVDDEPAVVSALKRELIIEGYNPEGFLNATEALDRVRKGGVFAVLTDYNMPGIRGDLLINQIQKEFPEIACIVITGQTTKDMVQHVTRSGKVARILPKPWDRQELLRTLESLKKEFSDGA